MLILQPSTEQPPGWIDLEMADAADLCSSDVRLSDIYISAARQVVAGHALRVLDSVYMQRTLRAMSRTRIEHSVQEIVQLIRHLELVTSRQGLVLLDAVTVERWVALRDLLGEALAQMLRESIARRK
jgi:hypothetical protein